MPVSRNLELKSLIFGVLALVAPLQGMDALAPGFSPVPGLPPSLNRYRVAERSPQGWVFTAAEGIAVQGETWKVMASDEGANLMVALPFNSGAIVLAGYGFVTLLRPDGREIPLRTTGAFYGGVTDGATALIVSADRACAVGDAGIVDSLPLQPGALVPRASLIDGKLVLFAPSNGVFELLNGKFVRSSDFNFALGQEISPVFGGADGAYTGLTKQGFFRYAKGNSSPLFPELWAKLRTRAVVGAAQFGSQFIVASYYDGLTGYDTSGAEIWNIPETAFGGNLYFIRPVTDGFMVGSSSGVFIFPDPARYSISRIPTGDLHAVIPTQSGPLLAVSSSVVHLDGRPTDFPDGIESVFPYHGGFVESYVGYLKLPSGQRVPLPDRDIPKFATLGDDLLLVHGQKLSLLTNGELRPIALPSPANSVAVVDGAPIIGTSAGAVQLLRDGSVERTFGVGLTSVKSLDEQHAVAFDSTGTLFDSEGVVLGQLPFSELLSAVNWRDSIVLLGRLPNGKFSYVRMGRSGTYGLDLPVASPEALVVYEGRLEVISPSQVLAVTDPAHLEFPSPGVEVITPDGTPGLRLRAGEDYVDLRVPPARLGEWAVPTYRYRVGSAASDADGKWEELAPGAVKRIPRLDWGTSRIAVQTSLGIETHATEFGVVRARPWWAQWPALVGYVLVLAVGIWRLVVARTRHLAEKARELQALVDERTADLKRAQAAREEFFSTLSHEIRNPLNGVVGLCDILAEAPPGSVGPKEKRLVTTLKGCAAQLRSMLDDVLDFSRIDRGDVQLNEETFDLVSAIEGSVRSVDAGLASAELVIPHDPVWVSGDCGKLRQIVTNLASNGLKYGVPSRIRVTLFTQITREGRLAAQIAVSNSGATIPVAELTRIFEGFARGEDAIRRRIPGSGLGLAVSRRMAQAMGGALTAQSHEGLTVFTLEVTLAISDAPVAVALTHHKPKLSRALAIEDESYNRVVLGHILGQLGYAVDWAVDGLSAMERVKTEAYDLVLTDYLLPDINGSELARRILREVPDPKPPVIAVTAYSTPEKLAELRAAGVSGVVAKPVSLEKMRTAIMALATSTGRRSLDTARAAVTCDFRAILETPGGAAVLAKYAADLLPAWMGVINGLDGDPDESAREVHAFLSRILVVQAAAAATLLSDLESALRLADYPAVRRLSDVLTPMIEDVAAQAKREASEAAQLR
jgi:signal transduction histidine kinase/CheY-like chemotaxis protein